MGIQQPTRCGLEDLVKSGKVIYTGLANLPAWKSAAIAIAVPLTALQFEYNLVKRDADRELMGMAAHFGTGNMFYSPLAGGLLTGKYRKSSTGRLTLSARNGYQEDAVAKKILDELETIAAEADVATGRSHWPGCLQRMGFRSLAPVLLRT